ncbi:MAG: GNAT family protein [Gemmatimonadota bacterium]
MSLKSSAWSRWLEANRDLTTTLSLNGMTPAQAQGTSLPYRAMNHAPVTLKGRLARLEPLTERHLPGLCKVGLDPDLWEWIPAPVTTESDMQRYVADALALAAEGSAIPFATIDQRSGEVAGCTRFGNIDLGNRRVEIGWTWLGRTFHRTGLNTEVKYLMLRHAFDTLHCVRVELKTDFLNQRSRAAIRRIGAVEEGVLRSHVLTHSGRLRDTVYYSILRDEWPSVRQSLEDRLR